ncbi:uncharacterized protein LY89DRAFT_486429 [Mollisia scopiformis]|uniref:Uncharacterized protein n=1 Tax=Mollisia scopiformis TaxID=149040 RepID=A0A194XGH5_MOLSC|nr:uncharacterized protein LY89DRAFT_486429 [Mollisia scopiformis]KUJ19241.1 hypothetical protein LY89DRAFT_486429 [Mollisia scopiformis]
MRGNVRSPPLFPLKLSHLHTSLPHNSTSNALHSICTSRGTTVFCSTTAKLLLLSFVEEDLAQYCNANAGHHEPKPFSHVRILALAPSFCCFTPLLSSPGHDSVIRSTVLEMQRYCLYARSKQDHAFCFWKRGRCKQVVREWLVGWLADNPLPITAIIYKPAEASSSTLIYLSVCLSISTPTCTVRQTQPSAKNSPIGKNRRMSCSFMHEGAGCNHQRAEMDLGVRSSVCKVGEGRGKGSGVSR